jgi:predicted  nucleic acid-binding Zn-ribbon protein
MIQAVLLIALGFLTAALIGALIAPSLWARAYRLSRKRLEQTLPITLAEIEAAQDQLRASYAVRMRRLETALAGAKQKAAMQIVDNSRLQMQIIALRDQTADLDLRLSERRNAATVLEQTITKRFPELDREITAVKQELQERSYELHDLNNKLSRRSEELEAAQRAAAAYEAEVSRLQQAFEKNSGDRGGRRFRRASQWSLDDYRSEYDRLNLELSKLRQQLAQLQDRDAQQAGLIKEELHKLSELILVSAQPRTEQPGAAPAARRALHQGTLRALPLPWPEAAVVQASSAVEEGGDSPAAPRREEGLVSVEAGELIPAAAGEPLAKGEALGSAYKNGGGEEAGKNEKAEPGPVEAENSALIATTGAGAEKGSPSIPANGVNGGDTEDGNAEKNAPTAPATPHKTTLLDRLRSAARESSGQ